ncbi:hypothetical protein ACQB60_22695 [Actinomycetota bacterium Odt1-20B]
MPKRFSLFALVAALLAVLAMAMASAPAQAAGFTPINVGKSSHCLDNATENASKLDFQAGLFTFTNARTGRCITAPASGAGTVTVQFCDASAAPAGPGTLRDRPGGGPSSGAQQGDRHELRAARHLTESSDQEQHDRHTQRDDR